MRAVRTTFLIFAFAAAASAQQVSLDPASLVWYPPDAPVAEYIAGKRSYAADLKKAFADPKLAAEVCRMVAATDKTAATTKEPRQKLQRITLEQACIATMREQKEAPAAAAHQTSAREYLTTLLAQEAAIDTTPKSERFAKQQAILDALEDAKPGVDMFKTLLRAMILRPEDMRGTYWILRLASYASSKDQPVSERDVRDFVESTYRARANASDANAWRWEFGLPELLLGVGKFDEARNLQAGLVTKRGYADPQYGQMMMAILDAMAGQRDAVDAALSKCKPSDRCVAFAREITWRATGLLQQRSPKPLLEALALSTRATGDDWPERLRALRRLASLDRVLGRHELTALYASPKVPEAAVIDAMRIDATISHREDDQVRSIALLDCWIRMRGGEVPPFPADAWSRIAAMKDPDAAGEKTAECFKPAPEPRDAEPLVKWDCGLNALLDRFNLALSAHNFDLARQSLEMMAAYSLSMHLAPTALRNSLVQLASELNGAGFGAEAQRVATYVESQPHSRVATMNLVHLRERLPKGSEVFIEPWQSPTRIPAGTLPEICGK